MSIEVGLSGAVCCLMASAKSKSWVDALTYMGVLMLGAQEQASSAVTPVLVAFTVNLINAAQKASSNATACDVVKRRVVKRYQLATRLSHGCLSSPVYFNTR